MYSMCQYKVQIWFSELQKHSQLIRFYSVIFVFLPVNNYDHGMNPYKKSSCCGKVSQKQYHITCIQQSCNCFHNFCINHDQGFLSKNKCAPLEFHVRQGVLAAVCNLSCPPLSSFPRCTGWWISGPGAEGGQEDPRGDPGQSQHCCKYMIILCNKYYYYVMVHYMDLVQFIQFCFVFLFFRVHVSNLSQLFWSNFSLYTEIIYNDQLLYFLPFPKQVLRGLAYLREKHQIMHRGTNFFCGDH